MPGQIEGQLVSLATKTSFSRLWVAGFFPERHCVWSHGYFILFTFQMLAYGCCQEATWVLCDSFVALCPVPSISDYIPLCISGTNT